MEIKKVITIAVIVFIIGLVLGLGIGASQSLNWCVGTALNFLEDEGIILNISEEELIWAINNYKYDIGQCYPPE